jgi:hypothetical protein
MQLRPEKNNPEEDSQEVDSFYFARHLAGITLLLSKL